MRKNNISFWGNEESKFNLRDTDFITKKKDPHRYDDECDVRITSHITRGNTSKMPYVYISLNNNTKKTICNAKYIKIGFAYNGSEERMYFMSDEDAGFKLTFQKSCKRGAAKIPVPLSEIKHVMRYDGEHDFKYDAYNKAYYIEPKQ